MSFVLDNSVALAWYFEDEETNVLMGLLDRVAASGAHAPLLWPLETLNGLLAAERRRRVDREKRLKLAEFLHDLPIRLDPRTGEQSWTASARLAEEHRLTLYDATYLELAQRRRLPLASLDQDLRRAAASLGLETLGA